MAFHSKTLKNLWESEALFQTRPFLLQQASSSMHPVNGTQCLMSAFPNQIPTEMGVLHSADPLFRVVQVGRGGQTYTQRTSVYVGFCCRTDWLKSQKHLVPMSDHKGKGGKALLHAILNDSDELQTHLGCCLQSDEFCL